MIAESIAFLVAQGKRVIYDAEHFFDGCAPTPRYALRLRARGRRGGRRERHAVRHQRRVAAAPDRRRRCATVVGAPGVAVGIHCHNDAECGVANTLAAVARAPCSCRGR